MNTKGTANGHELTRSEEGMAAKERNERKETGQNFTRDGLPQAR